MQLDPLGNHGTQNRHPVVKVSRCVRVSSEYVIVAQASSKIFVGNYCDGRLSIPFGYILWTTKQSMALRLVSVRLSALRQRSLLGWTGLGALTVGLAAANANWRSITHGFGSSRYILPLVVTAQVRSLHSAPQRLFSLLTSTSAGNMAPSIPPQPAPTWTHTADDVMRLTKEAIAKDQEVQDEVAALAPKHCNMSSVSDFEWNASDDY